MYTSHIYAIFCMWNLCCFTFRMEMRFQKLQTWNVAGVWSSTWKERKDRFVFGTGCFWVARQELVLLLFSFEEGGGVLWNNPSVEQCTHIRGPGEKRALIQSGPGGEWKRKKWFCWTSKPLSSACETLASHMKSALQQ